MADALKVGQEFQVRVLSIDEERKRLSLSRLSSKGALIGSDDDNEEDDVPDPAYQEPPAQRGTNLGDVLRRALEGN